MKKKLFLVCGTLVIAAVFVAVLLETSSKEPTYEGRTLSGWISIYSSGYSGTSPHATKAEMEAAEKAIRAMGTNCFPIVIKWMSKDYPKFLEFRHRNDCSTAGEVFQILGKAQASLATPALIQLTTNKDKEVRWKALSTLIYVIDPDKEIFTPALARLVHDPDKNISYYAAEWLADLDPPAAEKAGVYILYPRFAPDAESHSIQIKNEPLAK